MKETWTGDSAEKDFLIDRESGYFDAQTFAINPIEYLETFKATVLDDGGEEYELGIQAVERIRELCQVIQNEDIPVTDKKISALVSSEDMSADWARQVFALLKAAGYTKAVVKTWLLLDEPFTAVDDEMNHSRKLNEQLDEIYGIS